MATLADVEKLANELLNKSYQYESWKYGQGTTKHNIQPAGDLGYTFKFDNSKKRFGCCNYSKKTISLSRELCSLNLDKIETRITDCILHEIAHALCVHAYGIREGRGHGENWKGILLAIGGDGRRCYDSSKINKAKAKYTLVCDSCNTEYPRHRKSNCSTSCGTCSPKVYNEKFKMRLVQNY